MKVLAPLLFLAVLASSCGPAYVYQKSHDFPESGWAYADSITFDFEIQDTQAIYNLWLHLGHTTAYRNQNLYTRIHTRFPDGARIAEVLSLEMAGKGGQWKGACRGQGCHLEIPIQEGAYFNQPGAYQIVIEQYMRRDSVQGVEQLSFLLEDTGQKRGNAE